MKRLILLFFLLINVSFAFDLKKVDFSTFCNYVSFYLNKNIIISKNVNTKFSVFMPEDNLNKKILYKSFISILKAKNLSYKIFGNTILILPSKKPHYPTYEIRYYFLSRSFLKRYLHTFFTKYHYVIYQNRLLISCPYYIYRNLKFYIHSLEKSYLIAHVNFNIMVINNKSAKSLVTQLSAQNPLKHIFINFLFNSLTFSSSVPYYLSFYFDFLQKHSAAKTISKPTLALIDSHNYVLESVHNIPYVQKTVTLNKNDNPVTQSIIKYKSVGLKIYIKNVFITSKNIDFDMDIYLQTVVSYNNGIPVIDTKHLNTHVTLTPQDSNYLVAGLRTITVIKHKQNVPYLSSIPLIGMLFKSNDSSYEDLSFVFLIHTDFFHAKQTTPEERP